MLAPSMMMKMARSLAWIALTALLSIGCKQGAATVGPGDTDCGSCASVFANGGIPCDYTASSGVYDTLLDCACSKCMVECGDSLCAVLASNAACGDCVEMNCVSEQKDCAEN